MNWSFLLIGFAMAVFMGAGLVSLFATLRPRWTAQRRIVTAAFILPAITAMATLFGILFIATSEHGQSERVEDLAIAAMATLGGGFTLLALVGGLIGAALAGRKRHQ